MRGPKIEGKSSSHLLLPAKLGEISEGRLRFHPLICHMLDVAAVTAEIWERVLTAATQRQLADGLGLRLDEVGRWVAVLAGLHDLGKASPAFVSYLPAGHPIRRLVDMPMPRTRLRPNDAWHGPVSTLALGELLQGRGFPPKLSARLAAIIGGHHGILLADLPEVRSVLAIGADSWKRARKQLFDDVVKAVGPSGTPAAAMVGHPSAMVLAGLVSVADWIGSMEKYFPYLVDERDPSAQPEPPDPRRYYADAQARARHAIDELAWSSLPSSGPAESFEALFPGRVPRPLQVASLSMPIRAPGLIIIEAPTGEGKTEAALALADRLALADGSGMYVAMPTRATSDQMYGRVRKFLAQRYDADSTVLLHLLHGHASLSAEFEASLAVPEARGVRQVRPRISLVDDAQGEASVAASTWFTARKRGLLVPFGVGTVDQALLAALQTKHVFVRHFGLANKIVIFDEVHAYDAYMGVLLERLLEWLAAVGCSVVLLSATLPRARTRALFAAYARGLDVDTPGLESLAGYPRVTSLDRSRGPHSTSLDVSEAGRRTLALRWLSPARSPSDPAGHDALARWLGDVLAGGGCAAVICNTVARAQAVYRALLTRFSGEVDDRLPALELLHARFPFEDRALRENRILARFGPNAQQRPSRAVVVATQIIEQSLDLDFDIIVSDLAPIDLLLQRAGRLQRHLGTVRPARFEHDRTLHVLAPQLEGGVPAFEDGDVAVYDEHILLRTWHAITLDGRDVLVPDDVEDLVEAVYGNRDAPASAGEALLRRWQDTFEAMQRSIADAEAEAEKRWLKPPHSSGSLDRLMSDPGEEDEPGIHKSLQALTRLAEPSVDVVCIGADDPVPAERDALKRSLSISQHGLTETLRSGKAFDGPPEWRRSPLLRRHRLLRFDEQDECRVDARWLLRLDAETGLEITRL